MRRYTMIGLALLLGWLPSAAGEATLDATLDRLPKDPLLVTITNGEDLAGDLDAVLRWVARMADPADAEETTASLEAFDARLGCSLRDDLLGSIGPQLAFVLDLPPLDSLAVPETRFSQLLGKAGVLAAVGRRERFDACLRKLFALAEGARLEDEQGVVRVVFPLEANGRNPPEIRLYYTYRDGWFALGGAAGYVRSLLDERDEGDRLRDGADFARVFSALDAAPHWVLYVNLPELRELLASSTMLDADPSTRRVLEPYLAPEFSGMGFGASSVDVDGGVRTTTIGPSGLSLGAAALASAASAVVPDFERAVGREKQARTVVDIRSAGVACEAYAIDHVHYPSSEGSWVPLSRIESELSPVYIGKLPTVDGWGNPLQYRSDGEHYLIVSPGRDGMTGRDWTFDFEGGPTRSFDEDLVYGDGHFRNWPGGMVKP